MAKIGTTNVSLSKIQQEFGGSNPISITEYYRDGTYVPGISYNLGVPKSGRISLEDFIGARSVQTTTTTVPAYNTARFKAANGVRTYRVVHTFTVTENSRFEFDVDFTIMGDERESGTFTSTNRQLVTDPYIAIYVGGAASSGTTEPTGEKVLEATSSARSNNDDSRVRVSFDVANAIGEYGTVFNSANAYVVFSMYCINQGGPDAPLSRWTSPAFDVTIKTG